MMLRNAVIVSLLLVAAPISAASDKRVSLKDASEFATTLREMGYSVETSTTKSGMPQLITQIGGLQTSIVILGCNAGRNCSHIYLSSSYSDVPNPPDAWIAQVNDHFDFLKIGKSSDNSLFFSSAHFVEGLPRETMKGILDAWATDSSALADKAREAKLVE
jgi:hypothetical protein